MSEKKRSPLGIIFLTLFIDLVGFSIIFPLFPDLLEYYRDIEGDDGLFSGFFSTLDRLAGGEGERREFYTTVLFGGCLGSIYSLLQFLFAPFWGGLSDRIGRKPVLLISISGTLIGYAVWFLSGSFLLLIISRFLTGCMSGNIATASAAVADFTSGKDRAKGMGIIGAAFGLGFILGPAIGSFSSAVDLTQHFPDWKSFGVNQFSMSALVAMVLCLVNLVWVATRFQETLSSESRGQARLHRRPINPLVLFQKIDLPGVSRANFAYFLFIVAFSGIEFTITFFAKDRFGYTHETMWVLFVYIGFIIAAVQGGVVRRLAPRVGEKRLASVGLALLVPAFVIINFSPPSRFLLYVGLGLMAVGSALATPCLTALASLYTPADRQGSILGIFRSLGALGRAVGPLVFAMVYWKFGQQTSYLAGAALLVLPLLLAFGLPRPDKGEDEAAPAT